MCEKKGELTFTYKKKRMVLRYYSLWRMDWCSREVRLLGSLCIIWFFRVSVHILACWLFMVWLVLHECHEYVYLCGSKTFCLYFRRHTWGFWYLPWVLSYPPLSYLSVIFLFLSLSFWFLFLFILCWGKITLPLNGVECFYITDVVPVGYKWGATLVGFKHR